MEELNDIKGLAFIPVNKSGYMLDGSGKVAEDYRRDKVIAISLAEAKTISPYVAAVFRDSDYIGIDIDIKDGDKDAISAEAKKVFNQFEGYHETSKGGYGLHAVVKNKEWAEKLGDRSAPLKINKKDTGFNYDIELFGGYAPLSLTGNMIPDGKLILDNAMPIKILKNKGILDALGSLVASTGEKPSEALLEAHPSLIDADGSYIPDALQKQCDEGYTKTDDPSDADFALANAARGYGLSEVEVTKLLYAFMHKHRTSKIDEISNKVKVTVRNSFKDQGGLPADGLAAKLSGAITKLLDIVQFSSLPTDTEKPIYLNDIPFPKTGVVMFLGHGDVGKSYVTIISTIAYLKQHPAERALFWFTEDALAIVRKRIAEYEPTEDITSRMDFVSSEPVDGVEKIIDISKKYGVITLDPLISFFTGNENDNRDAREFAEKLKKIDALVFLIHHSSKSGSASRGASDFRNSGRIAYEVVTPKILLSKGTNKRSCPDPKMLSKRALIVNKDNHGITAECRYTVRTDEGQGYYLDVFKDDAIRKDIASQTYASIQTELEILPGKDIVEVWSLIPMNKPMKIIEEEL